MNIGLKVCKEIANRLEQDFGFRRLKCNDIALQFVYARSIKKLSLDKVDHYYNKVSKMIYLCEIL